MIVAANASYNASIADKHLRVITRYNYIAHYEPLLKLHDLLKMKDLFHLKFLEMYYYDITYELLPPNIDTDLQSGHPYETEHVYDTHLYVYQI